MMDQSPSGRLLRCVEPNYYPNSKDVLSQGILGILHVIWLPYLYYVQGSQL